MLDSLLNHLLCCKSPPVDTANVNFTIENYDDIDENMEDIDENIGKDIQTKPESPKIPRGTLFSPKWQAIIPVHKHWKVKDLNIYKIT